VPPEPTTQKSRPPSGRTAARSALPSTEESAVAITGIVGRLGRRLARRLHRDTRVIGIDRRPFDGRPKDIEHHQIDIRRKKTRDVFRSMSVGAVVHLGVMHDPRASASEHHTWNVAGFQKILEYVAQYRIPKLVLLSSANVYGPRPDNPQFLTEDAPLLGGASFSEIRDLVEIDMLAQSFFWKMPETETVILRPVHILGTVRNAPSNYLRLPVIPTLLGFDPMIQVVHEEDTVRAIELALRPGVRGIFNISGPPPAPLSRVVKATGRSSLPIPHPLAATMLAPLWRLRVASFPAPELDHIRYVCMVDDRRARETLGYAPTKSLEETVRAVDDGRWT
jgi:UDP-glucose 4-epimerase